MFLITAESLVIILPYIFVNQTAERETPVGEGLEAPSPLLHVLSSGIYPHFTVYKDQRRKKKRINITCSVDLNLVKTKVKNNYIVVRFFHVGY